MRTETRVLCVYWKKSKTPNTKQNLTDVEKNKKDNLCRVELKIFWCLLLVELGFHDGKYDFFPLFDLS